mgnify:CR=1 FL=1
MQHWWHEPLGEGVRTQDAPTTGCGSFTRSSNYVRTTGDAAILDEPVSFLEPTDVATGSHDVFERPRSTDERFSLFEHCARALDVSLVVGNARAAADLARGLERRLQPDRSGGEGRERLARLVPRRFAAPHGGDRQRSAATPSARERYHVKALELRESLTAPGTERVPPRLLRRWDAAGLLEQRGMPHRFHRPVMGRSNT